MTMIIVAHATEWPALDGMMAGELAAERGARFTILVGGGAGLSQFDGVQHVLAHGELAPNGVLWAERATGRPVEPPVDRGAVARLEAGTVLVAINPAIAAHRDAVERLRLAACAAARPLHRFDVREADDGTFAVSRAGEAEPVSVWRRDAFGRPVRIGGLHDEPVAGPPLRVLIVGDEIVQRDVYPATVAALGDAADAAGRAVSLRVLNPRRPMQHSWDRILGEADGLVLPGGSDMEQVRGQIEAARAAIRQDVPTLGLCLGLQTMSTAVAQEVAGLDGANLAEADPAAATKTFVRLHDERGRPEFRLGVRRCRVVPKTRLAALVDGAGTIDVHYNHRFVLDPALHGPLIGAGLRLCGLHEDRDLADAIEMPGLRFFLGLQGHPELASRRGAPHPVFAGFLAAVADR